MSMLCGIAVVVWCVVFVFFQAEDGIRDYRVTGVQTCALPILFPNQLHPDNHVKKGDRIAIPGPGDRFALPAELPAGLSAQRTLLVVLLTKTDLNAFKAGQGGEVLRVLRGSSARSFVVRPTEGEAGRDEYYAGKANTVIRK